MRHDLQGLRGKKKRDPTETRFAGFEGEKTLEKEEKRRTKKENT
jgi:hypothetical protein